MANRPRSRERNVRGEGKDIYRRGSGLGTRPSGGGFSSRPSSFSQGSFRRDEDEGDYDPDDYSPRRARRSSKRRKVPIWLIILLFLLLFKPDVPGTLIDILGYTLSSGGSSYSSGYVQTTPAPLVTAKPQVTPRPSSTASGTSSPSAPALSGSANSSGYQSLTGYSSGWTVGSNTGSLDSSVVSGVRDRYTQLLGQGKDTVTIMVYMCGADLESRSGMATADLQEMLNAGISDQINLLVYTGGARQWKNNVVSSTTNQIYRMENDGLRRLEADLGNISMTRPETLTSFIQYCARNYPASRYELILWDHGSGSIAGYGYDEHYAGSGSMTLQGISEALKKGKVKFDFIGFDACLMATVENALMLNDYADYLIASEETEPGVGWYYTNWLTCLSQNTSLPTVEIGRMIVDDFVNVCAKSCAGQKTTLSVVDLAELSKTVPSALRSFASSTLDLLGNGGYKTVTDSRAKARSFATSSKVDLVDLVSLAQNLGTSESRALANAVLGAVKYNRTSSNMTNAYGLSIYFPYQKAGSVSSAVKAYDAIGMDEEYTEVIRRFAALQAGGQAVSGGYSSALPTLQGTTQTYSGSDYSSTDLIVDILTQLMSGRLSSMPDLDAADFLDRSLDPEKDSLYLLNNRFDPDCLVWTTGSHGSRRMYLSEKNWDLVHDLELNVYVDDGEGYIDLGLDNVFEFTGDGALSGEYFGTWLAIDRQPVAYYRTDTTEDGDHYTITGYVPAFLNGERVNLILVFSDEQPYGYVAGAEIVYDSSVTDTTAKNLTQIKDGDVLDFVCDYYTYQGRFIDSYILGDSLTVSGELEICDVDISRYDVLATYRFTDIYQQHYWTPVFN